MGRLFATTALFAVLVAAPASAQVAAPDVTVPAARDTEPVVLTGKDFADISVPNEQTVRPPLVDYVECPLGSCPASSGNYHSHYSPPLASTATLGLSGVAVDRLRGYRWQPGPGWVQIPFQVDEVFTRYLNNTASGFSNYSGEDRHTTYAYDREGFRWTDNEAGNPCLAKPASPVATDPVKGLDHDDELAFMASDAGAFAPSTAPLPPGIESVREVRVEDPTAPGAPRYAYVMVTAPSGGPAVTATPHVGYARDANANLFVYSQSSYGNYGNAPKGPHCDEAGNLVMQGGQPKIAQRRPLDRATITTPRYRYRYDGRWLMTRIEVSGDGGASYGPDLVDRWKARAFQQDPESETPCCGFEEEDTNWGGSSILLGEKAGPVRIIRETWGADSGTNVIRRETFYRDEMRQKTWLRVHVIPPLDGIYAQWDFNAGIVDKFFSGTTGPSGVDIDGVNDEMVVGGNLDDPCNPRYESRTLVEQAYRELYAGLQGCSTPYHQSVDVPDPTHSAVNASHDWAVTAGSNGSIVDRISTAVENSPGGVAQGMLAVPYYRDDSCFDDGTGDDPGPNLAPRTAPEPRAGRRCWTKADGVAGGRPEFFQGAIGTHGVHILTLVDSDNARQTVPLTEIVSDWRMVMLPGRADHSHGERYGRGFEKPLVSTVKTRTVPTATRVRATVLNRPLEVAVP